MRTFFCLVLVASAAHADFKRLHAERATATSFLESNWNKYQENYHPTYVLDDDPSTAWVEGAEGDGVGQSLTVKVSALKKANALKLVITPGYQKSKALFAANGTPTQLGLEVRSNAGDVTTKTEPASVWEFTVTDSKIGSIRQRTLSSFIGDPDGPGGLSPDEGISSVLATFEPKPKK